MRSANREYQSEDNTRKDGGLVVSGREEPVRTQALRTQ
jgi:hypothetical protein